MECTDLQIQDLQNKWTDSRQLPFDAGMMLATSPSMFQHALAIP